MHIHDMQKGANRIVLSYTENEGTPNLHSFFASPHTLSPIVTVIYRTFPCPRYDIFLVLSHKE